MRIFRLAQEEDDMLKDSIRDVLTQISNPSSSHGDRKVSRSFDKSAYVRNGTYVFKCSVYAGGTLTDMTEDAKVCHEDAVMLAEGFNAAGIAAECTRDQSRAALYSGFGGAILIKCTVAVHHDDPDLVWETARKLGIRR